jgi:chaperonin GroES
MNLKPLGNHLVILPAKQEDQTTSGLFLPESAKEKPQQGKVIAAGPGSRKENGDRILMDVKIEDTVLYVKYAGTTIKLEGQDYLILKETDLLAIIGNGHK